MILKFLFLVLICLIPLRAYTEENGVLILNDDDLTNITEIFPHVFIKYYVTWCKHCQKLAPIFEEVAQELQAQNSTIRLAKINCDESEKALAFENLERFPTLVFYNHGEKLHFDGDRQKGYLFKWLTKRLSSPIKQITQQQLEKMRKSEDSEVAIVFHGELQSIKGAAFTNTAYQDNYNNYFFIKQHTKPYGTVQLLRSFADDVELPYPDDDFYFWIWQHDRPTVVPLDIRSITSVFRDGHLGFLLFLQERNLNKLPEFKTAAENWKKNNNRKLIYIAVSEGHQDFFGLLEYMDINPIQTPAVIVDSENQKKYTMQLQVGKMTSDKIQAFLSDFDAGKVLSSPLESQHVHHHHDHDHQHDHHHHHHNHDHHDHHHHHDHDHDHDHEHLHDHHHHHHHHEHQHDHKHGHDHHSHENPQENEL